MHEPEILNVTAFVGEAMNKSGILWIEVPDDRTWPAWFVRQGDAALVVSGPGEQTLPWLPDDVVLILRSKDSGGRLVSVRARAEVLAPGTPAWTEAAEALRASRLNAVDDCLPRWADTCTITALRPYGSPVEGPGGYDTSARRVQPPASAATTRGRRPWHWRGRGSGRRTTL